MRHRSAAAITISIFMMIFLLSACGQGSVAPEPVMDDGYYLDTVCSISIYRMEDAQGDVRSAADVSEEAQSVISEAFDLCSELSPG